MNPQGSRLENLQTEGLTGGPPVNPYFFGALVFGASVLASLGFGGRGHGRFDAYELHIKEKASVGHDDLAHTPFSISKHGGDKQLPLGAHRHELQGFPPAGDNTATLKLRAPRELSNSVPLMSGPGTGLPPCQRPRASWPRPALRILYCNPLGSVTTPSFVLILGQECIAFLLLSMGLRDHPGLASDSASPPAGRRSRSS